MSILRPSLHNQAVGGYKSAMVSFSHTSAQTPSLPIYYMKTKATWLSVLLEFKKSLPKQKSKEITPCS